MRKLLKFVGGAGIAAALIGIGILTSGGITLSSQSKPHSPWPQQEEIQGGLKLDSSKSVEIATLVPDRSPDQTLTLKANARESISVPQRPTPIPTDPPKKGRFAKLPIGQPQTIDFEMDKGTRMRLTPRQRKDQLRDWLLFTVVSNAGLEADQVNRVLFDVPPVRFGHVQAVAHFEYGETRTCVLGDGEVIALIPKCEQKERRDHLASIADEQRKTLGAIPDELLVFEYELEPEKLLGTLTRLENVPGRDAYTARYGYYETRAQNLEDFQRFMAAVQDVTYVHREGNVLTLGGRKLLSRKYRGFRVEDVAAVWQAQKKLIKKRDSVFAEFRDKVKTQVEQLRRTVWQPRLDVLNRTRRNGLILEFEYQQQFQKLQSGYESASAALTERLQQEFALQVAKMRLIDHTGFSLDPKYDYDGLETWFKSTARKKIDTVRTSPLCKVTEGDLNRVERDLGDEELKARRIVPLLEILEQIRKCPDSKVSKVGRELHRKVRFDYQFQIARYDGDLQGTEVGMILFYTDLLAKLWESVDYGSPKNVIPEFATSTDGGTAPFYRQETIKHPSTRLWFGPEKSAYQLVDNRRGVLFARKSTRIFAASSNPLFPGEEVKANYASQRTIGWWNDHYEELAAYEQEYERLNEYIKWSLVISWLFSEEKEDTLSFLRDVSVDHSAWFPEWVKRHPELKFNQWSKVSFFPKGHKGTTTEAIPLLESRPFRDYGELFPSWTISGGVSGARPHQLKLRDVLKPSAIKSEIKVSLRGIDLKSIKEGGRSFTTLEGATHDFSREGQLRSTMRVTPTEKAKFQSTHGELRKSEINRTVTQRPNETVIKTKAAEAELGELHVGQTRNGFSVGHKSRSIDEGQSIAHDLSRQSFDSPEQVLSQDARVRTVVRDGDVYYVQHSEGWMKLSREKQPSAEIPSGWDGRVADTAPYSKTWNVAFDSPPPSLKSTTGEWVRVTVPKHQGQKVVIEPNARGPPAEGKTLDLVHGTERVSAKAAADGSSVWVKRSELPPTWKEGPEHLAVAIERMPAFRKAGLNPRKTIANQKPNGALEAGSASPRGPPQIVRLLVEGKRGEAAALLAKDPKVRLQIVEYRQGKINEIHQLLDQGHTTRALAEIAPLEKIHGKTPETEVLKGMALLQKGRTREASVLLNQAGTGSGGNNPLLREISHRVDATLPPSERTARLRSLRHQALRDLKAQAKSKAEKVEMNEKGEVVLGLKNEPQKPTPPKDFDPTGPAELYLADNLKIPGIDGSPTVQKKALNEAVAAGKAELLELHKPDPGLQTRPDVLVLQATKTGAAPKTTRFTKIPKPHSRRLRYHRVHYRRQGPPYFWEEEEEEDEKERMNVLLTELLGGRSPGKKEPKKEEPKARAKPRADMTKEKIGAKPAAMPGIATGSAKAFAPEKEPKLAIALNKPYREKVIPEIDTRTVRVFILVPKKTQP